MDIKVIDNFLPEEEYLRIKNVMESTDFPWYFNPTKINTSKSIFNFHFGHVFYVNNAINSDFFELLNKIIEKLKPLSLIRIKANLTPVTHKLIKYDAHTDQEFPSKAALYYVNTNNGYTVFGDKKVESIGNRIVLFNANEKHYGTNSTNCKDRIVINFNYF